MNYLLCHSCRAPECYFTKDAPDCDFFRKFVPFVVERGTAFLLRLLFAPVSRGLVSFVSAAIFHFTRVSVPRYSLLSALMRPPRNKRSSSNAAEEESTVMFNTPARMPMSVDRFAIGAGTRRSQISMSSPSFRCVCAAWFAVASTAAAMDTSRARFPRSLRSSSSRLMACETMGGTATWYPQAYSANAFGQVVNVRAVHDFTKHARLHTHKAIRARPILHSPAILKAR